MYRVYYFLFSFFLCAFVSYNLHASEKTWKPIKAGSGSYYICDDELNVLGPIPGVDANIEIIKINTSGRVAGNYLGNRAFVWDPIFGFLDLGHLSYPHLKDSELMTRVVDMNENGEIIGYTCNKMTPLLRAGIPFVWRNYYMEDISNDFAKLGFNKYCLSPKKITNQGEIFVNSYQGNEKGKPVDSSICMVWKDGKAERLFQDHNKFSDVLPLDITEDSRILFTRKMPTNRCRLFIFDRSTQQETFLQEIPDNSFYID
jgi:hypothetical protein